MILLKALISISLILFLTGCESAYFYLQAARGQSALFTRQTLTEELVKSKISPVLRGRIEKVEEILQFAENLGRPSGAAYVSYIETGQRGYGLECFRF